jgi:hypothetical protein
MEFKEETIGDIIESEGQMILHGAERFGEYFINASEFNNLLNKFIKSIDDPTRLIFLLFLSQVRKHHILALFSSVRLHHVQAGMNLRQVMEAGQWAAYALGNIEEEKFFDKDRNGIINTTSKHWGHMYKWFDKNFKAKAEEVKNIKKQISSSVGHSNIAYTFQNLKIGFSESPSFRNTYFDSEDEYLVKNDLWFVANTAMGLLDLFYGVNLQYKVFRVENDFLPTIQRLTAQNHKLRAEMVKSPRHVVK